MYEVSFLWKPVLEKEMVASLTNATGQRVFLGQFFNSLEFPNSYFAISSSYIKNLLAESPLKNWPWAQETFSGNTSIQFSCLNKSRLAHSAIYKRLSKGPPSLSKATRFRALYAEGSQWKVWRGGETKGFHWDPSKSSSSIVGGFPSKSLSIAYWWLWKLKWHLSTISKSWKLFLQIVQLQVSDFLINLYVRPLKTFSEPR